MSLATTKRYVRDRVRPVGRHAVVVGASVAGLLAARVLVDAFDRVTVIDRDPLDAGTQVRRGVPQGRHVHTLLAAGQAVMEDLLPGLAEDLVAAGAVVVDMSEFTVHAADGFIAQGSGGRPMYFASRPLIEELVRSRVARHGRVRLLPGWQAGDYLAADGAAVGGVEAQRGGERRDLRAELTVDATGRQSRTASWLERQGFPAPPTEVVQVDLSYRTCQLRRPDADRRAALVMPAPPRTRGGAVCPVEGERWIVTLFGLHGDHPPGDIQGLRAFAGGLPTPLVRELLEEHDPVAPDVARFRFPRSTRHRYDRLRRLPAGLLCVGDAMASFNPIYGQGMSVAALEALALHHALASSGLDGVVPSFYTRARRVIWGPWALSAGGDFGFAQTAGDKPPGTDVVNRYVTRLHRKAHADPRLADAFADAAALVRPPTSLFRPRVAWRVLRPGRPG